MDMAVDLGGFLDAASGNAHQVETDRQEILSDNLQLGLRQQGMDVSHAAGNGILDGDHPQFHGSRRQQLKSVLEAGTWNAFRVGEHFPAGEVRVGSRLSLIGNL